MGQCQQLQVGKASRIATGQSLFFPFSASPYFQMMFLVTGGKDITAVCYDRYGGRDRLRFGAIRLDDPGPGEVIVRVTAAALNPIDWKLREGQARWVYRLKSPAGMVRGDRELRTDL